MKHHPLIKTVTKPVALAAFLFLSFAFKSFAGGDYFEVYLNKKLVAKKFAHEGLAALNMQLDKANYNDQITILYSHCGAKGKNRSIVLKDDKGNTLKSWDFGDAKSNMMVIPVKEILNAKKSNTHINIYYASNELPKGRLIVSVNTGAKNTVFNKDVSSENWSLARIVYRMPLAIL